MPIPLLAAVPSVLGFVGKVGGKIGGFFKKLFGGKKRRKAARLAAKQQRIETASNTVLANKIAKLEKQANVGEAKAGVKLARIQKQLARQGISFDPGVQDATLSDLGIRIPDLFRKPRNPQVFQQPQRQGLQVIQAGLPGSGFNIQAFLAKPMNLILVLVGVLLIFGRKLFK